MKFGELCQGIHFLCNQDPAKGPVYVLTEDQRKWLIMTAQSVYVALKDKEVDIKELENLLGKK